MDLYKKRDLTLGQQLNTTTSMPCMDEFVLTSVTVASQCLTALPLVACIADLFFYQLNCVHSMPACP